MFDNDEDATKRADETMRTDPARRRAVRAQIAAHQEAFQVAQAKVHDAYQALAALGATNIGDYPLLEQCFTAVSRAQVQLDGVASLILHEPTETYVDNQAAFGRPTGWRPTPPQKAAQ